MKKNRVWLLAAVLIFLLSACGKSSSGESQNISDASGDEQAAATESAEGETPQSTSNTTYNVGDFTVFVPAGWEAIPVPDHNDPSKTATNDIQLAKNALYEEATKEWNTEEGASFYITYLDKEDFAKVPQGRDYYAKDYAVTDMEDMTIGDLTWQGFSVKPIGAPVYMLWAASGEGGYYTSISTAYDLSLEDADVQAILGSLQ